MQWLVLSWALTCGWLPNSETAIIYPGTHAEVHGIWNYNTVSTKVELNAELFNHLKIWSSVKTREGFNSDISMGLFSPYEAYFIGGVAIHSFGFEIGISHECDHGIEYDVGPNPWISNGQTEVYVKISGKTSW
jgi:hypothetical protein